jgi:hypothetical protein
LTLPVCRRALLTFIGELVVVLVLDLVVVDDPQDLDEAEGGSQPPAGPPPGRGRSRPQAGRLAPRWLVAAGPQVQIHPAALELELVDLALAVVLAAGLEGQHLQVVGQVLSSVSKSRTVIYAA